MPRLFERGNWAGVLEGVPPQAGLRPPEGAREVSGHLTTYERGKKGNRFNELAGDEEQKDIFVRPTFLSARFFWGGGWTAFGKNFL